MKTDRFSQGGKIIILSQKKNGKLQCFVCMQVLSVPREFNLKRHYTYSHEDNVKKYESYARIALLEDCKNKCKQQTGIFSRMAKIITSSLTASYKVALQLARCKKHFSDRLLVKKMCAVEMAKAFGYTNMAEIFETVSLSHLTVSRTVAVMSGQVAGKLDDIV
jgi:hypothetical protein